MAFLDRTGITLKCKKAFYDWLDVVYPQHPYEGNSPGTFFLLPEYLYEEKHIEAFIKKNFKLFFQKELSDWIGEMDIYPKIFTYKKFTEFFDITFCDIVYDITKEDDD